MRFRRNEWARNLEKTRCCSPAAVSALDAHDVTRVLVAGRTGRRRLRTDTVCSSLANVPVLLAEGDARGTFAILVRALAVPTARVRGAASFVAAARCRVVGNIVIVMGHRHVSRIRVSTLRCAHLQISFKSGSPRSRGPTQRMEGVWHRRLTSTQGPGARQLLTWHVYRGGPVRTVTRITVGGSIRVCTRV